MGCRMLKKLYAKSQVWFSVFWIISYCVLMSAGDRLSEMAGLQKSFSMLVGLVLSVLLFAFLKNNGLLREYGLCRPSSSAGEMLYYIPLLCMMAANIWGGFCLRYGVVETLLYIFTMFCVGFLEEVIFRGLLFNAMRKDDLRWAVLVSSLTFGMGHIINLINGSGAQLLPNLMQVIYATAAGFMFVMIYLKTNSLVFCIAAHGVFNALSVFSCEPKTIALRVLTCVFLTLVTGTYGLFIALSMKRKGED